MPESVEDPAMFPSVPLTAAAAQLKKSVLAIPRTEEPTMTDLTPGLDPVEVEYLHSLLLAGSKEAALAIRKVIERFPKCPTLLNYLHIAYQISGQRRQADAALKQLAAEHPDYLFTRLGLAIKALEHDDTAKALAQLGPDLDIRALYPQRDVFHVSELTNYYKLAAMVHARSGNPDLALGLKEFISGIIDDPQAEQVITYEVMRANMTSMQTRMKADGKRRVEVRIPPLSKKIVTRESPVFRHEEIHELYQHGMDIPQKLVRSILALPRMTLVDDLARVLDDCAARTPNFMSHEVDENDFAAFHALHLLADIDGAGALESLLGFLSLHPDALAFWLGAARNYAPQIARVIAADIPRCAAWLRSPGIHCRPKGILIESMEQLAKSDPRHMDEVVSALEETLSFVIESPKSDNVLDTVFIGHLISALIDLRASRALPAIQRAYQKDLVELFMVGAYDSFSSEMEEPMRPAEKFLPILKQYAEYGRDMNGPAVSAVGDEETDAVIPFGSRYELPAPAPEIGRNDPCPCGSGKKYKKCCMK
jgi:hypothetical protein